MPDRFQSGFAAALTLLEPGGPPFAGLAGELRRFTRRRPLTLVLPCHAEELGTPALAGIVETLRGVNFLSRVFVGLDGATRSQLDAARRLFHGLPCETSVLWTSAPPVKETLAALRRAKLPAGAPGKGRNLWLCFGAAMAGKREGIIATHDCDIRTYDARLLERLCYPVARSEFGFAFCKGFAARYSDRLHGRVMRLFFAPFLRALRAVAGGVPLLDFLSSFRYPLAGETAMDARLAWRLAIPADWGVEAGMLAGVFRACGPGGVAQSEVAARYDHKHRKLSPSDPRSGLHRMARDIAATLLRALAEEGAPLGAPALATLLEAYRAEAARDLRLSAAQAAINGLKFDRRLEDLAVRTFLKSAAEAARDYTLHPRAATALPSHETAAAACPGLHAALQAAAHSC